MLPPPLPSAPARPPRARRAAADGATAVLVALREAEAAPRRRRPAPSPAGKKRRKKTKKAATPAPPPPPLPSGERSLLDVEVAPGRSRAAGADDAHLVGAGLRPGEYPVGLAGREPHQGRRLEDGPAPATRAQIASRCTRTRANPVCNRPPTVGRMGLALRTCGSGSTKRYRQGPYLYPLLQS